MSNNYSTINTIIGAIGLVGIGYGLAMHSKLAKVSDKLDTSIDKLADGMEIDIPEELVRKAVNKAVDSEVQKALNKAANEAVDQVRRDIRVTVGDAVNKEYSNIKDSVLKEITVSASKIDEARVRKDVEKAAQEMALKKFDVNLDSILTKFNNDLDNTAKIYSTIKGMMTPAPAPAPTSNNREYVIRVG